MFNKHLLSKRKCQGVCPLVAHSLCCKYVVYILSPLQSAQNRSSEGFHAPPCRRNWTMFCRTGWNAKWRQSWCEQDKLTMAPTEVGQKSKMESPWYHRERRSRLLPIDTGRTTKQAWLLRNAGQFLFANHDYTSISCTILVPWHFHDPDNYWNPMRCLSPPTHRLSHPA